jgi:hypothetical protein
VCDQSVRIAIACDGFLQGFGALGSGAWGVGPIIHPSITSFHPTDQAGKLIRDRWQRPHFSAQLATLFGAANHVKFGDEF